jgi:hypothetical protein
VGDEEERQRRAILERRQRFVRLALIGATAAATGTACVCLSPPVQNDAGHDAGSVPGDADDDGSTP